MHTTFAKTLPPVLSLLVLLGFAGLVVALFLVVKVTALKMSGWNSVTERFPMRTVSLIGANYKNQHGVIGNIGSGGARGFFDIEFAQEGLCVHLAFTRRKPCLIPWPAIQRVSISETTLLVAVSYERPFQFFLPLEALPTLRAKLPLESFHQAISPFDLSKAAARDARLPRWMSAMIGRVIQSNHKQIDEEKR